MAEKLDLSGFIFDQTFTCAISREVLNKYNYDEVIKSIKPPGNWALMNLSSSGDEILLSFRNDDHADRFL